MLNTPNKIRNLVTHCTAPDWSATEKYSESHESKQNGLIKTSLLKDDSVINGRN